ncbi:IPT/TIG domain-containing protein [Nocardia amikacinitolerans]|nr:IPT/TIG domain-containing protein [Nocardia amikacinitolerans]
MTTWGSTMAAVLTSLTPSSGPATAFTSVVIAGSGFSGVGPLTVRFGTKATTFTIDSDTQITAISPTGTGTVDVTVTIELDGTSNALPYTYV